MEPQSSCTIPRFLKYLLGNTFEKSEVELEDAYVLQALDPSEIYLHIEFPTDNNGLTKPVCWRINFWRQNTIRIMRMKEQANIERIEACKLKENATRVAKAMAAFTGLPFDVVYPIAYKNVAKTKNTTAASNFGVTLDI